MSESEINFELTRSENDTQLLCRIDEINSGQDIKVLEPFARAYLGLFYEIDKAIAPEARIAMLANQQLANAVLNGFVNALQRDDLPSPEILAEAVCKNTIVSSAYVVLAGIDRLIQQNPEQDVATLLSGLSDSCRQAAMIAHYANTTQHPAPWFDVLIKDEAIAIPSFTRMWKVMIHNKAHMLMGLREIVSDDKYSDITHACILQVLEDWDTCKLKTFKELIIAALKYADHGDLLKLAWKMLNQARCAENSRK